MADNTLPETTIRTPRPNAWAIVSLACAAAMVLLAILGQIRDVIVTAERESQGNPGIATMGFGTAFVLSLFLSPVGVVSGIAAWIRSPRSRWLAGTGVLACTAPWLVLFLAAELDLVDSAPNCGCDRLEAEQ